MKVPSTTCTCGPGHALNRLRLAHERGDGQRGVSYTLTSALRKAPMTKFVLVVSKGGDPESPGPTTFW